MLRPDRIFYPYNHYAIQEMAAIADTSSIRRKFLDLSYAGLSDAQKLDIYLPDDGHPPYPVIIAIHGGAFMGCDKGDTQVVPMLSGLRRGFAVVSINYRMSGEAKWPALVQDAKAAVRWVRGNAGHYGLNPEKIVAWGGSAGGYLAAMLAVTSGIDQFEDPDLGYLDFSSAIQAAVIWYGPTNFLKMDEQLAQNGLLAPPEMRHNTENSPESLLLGRLISSVPDLVRAANPETYITNTVPPMLFQHGRLDAIVPYQQSMEFVKKIRAAVGDASVIFEILENAEHGDLAFETPENVDRVFRFLKNFYIC